MPFPDDFSTERLRAERLTPAHRDVIRAMHADAQHMALLGGVRDAAASDAYLERNLRHWDDYGFGVWMLRATDTDRIAGRALLRHLDIEGRDEIEVGYGFNPEFWGRGLATEIASECLRLGHTQLGISSIVAVTFPHNARSRRVMEKVGMHFERDVIHDEQRHVLYRWNAR